MPTPSDLWIVYWARMNTDGSGLEDYTYVDFLPEKESPWGAYYIWEGRALRQDPDTVLCVIYPEGAADPQEALFRFPPGEDPVDETDALRARGIVALEEPEVWPASYQLLSWQVERE